MNWNHALHMSETRPFETAKCNVAPIATALAYASLCLLSYAETRG